MKCTLNVHLHSYNFIDLFLLWCSWQPFFRPSRSCAWRVQAISLKRASGSLHFDSSHPGFLFIFRGYHSAVRFIHRLLFLFILVIWPAQWYFLAYTISLMSFMAERGHRYSLEVCCGLLTPAMRRFTARWVTANLRCSAQVPCVVSHTYV